MQIGVNIGKLMQIGGKLVQIAGKLMKIAVCVSLLQYVAVCGSLWRSMAVCCKLIISSGLSAAGAKADRVKADGSLLQIDNQ